MLDDYDFENCGIKMKTIALLLFSATLASARIGETLEQCVERYGKVMSTSKDTEGRPTSIFIKGTFTVTVRFVENKSCEIFFSKMERFTDIELKTLISANGTNWAMKGPNHWISANTQRTAMCSDDHKFLAIYDDAVVDKEIAKKLLKESAKQSKNLEGF